MNYIQTNETINTMKCAFIRKLQIVIGKLIAIEFNIILIDCWSCKNKPCIESTHKSAYIKSNAVRLHLFKLILSYTQTYTHRVS